MKTATARPIKRRTDALDFIKSKVKKHTLAGSDSQVTKSEPNKKNDLQCDVTRNVVKWEVDGEPDAEIGDAGGEAKKLQTQIEETKKHLDTLIDDYTLEGKIHKAELDKAIENYNVKKQKQHKKKTKLIEMNNAAAKTRHIIFKEESNWLKEMLKHQENTLSLILEHEENKKRAAKSKERLENARKEYHFVSIFLITLFFFFFAIYLKKCIYFKLTRNVLFQEQQLRNSENLSMKRTQCLMMNWYEK